MGMTKMEAMKLEATWKPHELQDGQSDLPDSVFAFPKQRKEPLTDASHVKSAIARFDQVIGVSDEDRELAVVNITKAAEYYGIEMAETDWTQSGRAPRAGRKAGDRREPARVAAATRRRRNRLGE
jgi:hypothetical protein